MVTTGYALAELIVHKIEISFDIFFRNATFAAELQCGPNA
jgi:hypothetical protein